MAERPSRFSLRTFPAGRLGAASTAPAEGAEAAAAPLHATSAVSGADPASADPRDPTVETLRRSGGSGSGEWEADRSDASRPSLVASLDLTRDMDITWHPPDQFAPGASAPSQPSTEIVPPPLSETDGRAETPSRPAPEAASPAAGPSASTAPSAEPKPRRRLQGWDVVVDTIVVLVVAYLLLAGGSYAYRLWQARQTNSVTLVADIGHGGDSQITVLFTADDWLQVTEIDNDDPTRVTRLAVTQAIALASSKVVVEAWFQAVLVPGRLDLVMQLDGELDWPPFHPQFTTVLINNVAAVKKDPHAPGLRAPSATELQHALRALSA